MCGITGHFHANLSREQLISACDLLSHRGPDGQGIIEYASGQVGMAHRRLSIIDLSEDASQPFEFDGLVLTFNGELYNYKEIRLDLLQLGYGFKTTSDTEVLIKAYHCWREQAIERFIGIFAFAIYDNKEDKLFLCRDRLGVKPLYYKKVDKGGIIFASELKVFSQLLENAIDPSAIEDYFRFGYISEDRTIFRDVKKLRPGYSLNADGKGSITNHCYWAVSMENSDDTKTEEQWTDELEELLIDSFKFRMVSDVPVGIFLSGGIDSSLLAAILQKYCGTINTFTIGFNEHAFDESPYARQVAAYLNTDHHEQILSVARAHEEFDRFYDIYDEPFSDTSGIPVSLVSALAQSAGMKVVLSADGGDELFGGYPHYSRVIDIYKSVHRIPRGARRLLSGLPQIVFPGPLRENFQIGNAEHRIGKLEELFQQEGIDFFESYISNSTSRELRKLLRTPRIARDSDSSILTRSAMMDWDLHHYLPDDLLVKIDRATMYHGLEGRDPFLDHRLVEFCCRMPEHLKFRDGSGKYLLKKVLQRYLPQKLFDRPKMGFSIPLFQWFANDLDRLFDKVLTREKVERTGWLNVEEVEREIRKYRLYKSRGKPYNIEKMWRLLSFVQWNEKWNNP